MIDFQKVQEAQAMVQAFGALTNSTTLVVQQIKEAVPVMASKVDAGSVKEHIHSGLLNVTVSKIDEHVLVHVDATLRGGRSRMADAYLN